MSIAEYWAKLADIEDGQRESTVDHWGAERFALDAITLGELFEPPTF